MKRTRAALPAISSPVTPLLGPLKTLVLPRAGTCEDEWFTLCDPGKGRLPPLTTNKSAPGTVTSTSSPLRGRRVAVKPHAGRENVPVSSQVVAQWPDDAAQASRTAMMLCVIKGTADLRVGDHILTCGTGTFLFIPPNVPLDDGSRSHLQGRDITARGCSIMWISPAGAGIACWRCNSQGEKHSTEPLESCYILYPPANQLFETLMQELEREASATAARRALTCRPLFIALLNVILREMQSENMLQFAHQRLDESHLEDRADPVGRAQEYIRSHLNQTLTIDQVARLTYLSRSQFTRRFREETGRTFNEFVTDRRLEEARYLLRTTDWNIEQICKAIGMKSSRLRSLFRQNLEASPSLFRRVKSVEKPTKLKGNKRR